MKRLLLFVATLALLISLTLSITHYNGTQKATNEEPPPNGTTTIN